MKIDTDDLATLTQLAHELDLTPAALINYRNRHATFPKPVLTDGRRAHYYLRWQVLAFHQHHTGANP